MDGGSFRTWVVPLLLSCVCACSDEGPAPGDADAGPDAGVDTVCPPGLAPYKTACLPLLDECEGNAVPIPGGGCKRIGVEECAIDGVPGIKGPPDWTCKRIGVQECTVDGVQGIKGPPDWTCKAVGPKTCATGWTRVAGGWCEPVLPNQTCPKGTMEVIGKSTCQEVGDCGSGPWGKIQLAPGTVFVDASFVGISDGSQAKPFRTLNEAVAAASDSGHVAVAAGTYHEDVVVDRPLTVEGRCPKLVRVTGVKGGQWIWDGAALRITAKGVVLRGLGVTGSGAGVLVEGGEAVLEQLVVQGTGIQGILVLAGQVSARDSLVENARFEGASARFGASLELERVTVRGTRAHPLISPSSGAGVAALPSLDNEAASLVLRDSVVKGNVGNGVAVAGSVALVERSTVRDGEPFPATKTFGDGIHAISFEGGPRAQLTIKDSEVAGNRLHGVALGGAEGVIEGTVVRDTRSHAVDNTHGVGVHVTAFQGHAGSLNLKRSVLARNRTAGLVLLDAGATVEGTLILETQAQESDNQAGVGVLAVPDQYAKEPQGSTLVLRDSVVAGNHVSGIEANGSTATIERSIVRDGVASPLDKTLGRGIVLYRHLGQPAALTLRDSLIRNNRYWGVEVSGATATVERTVVEKTLQCEDDNPDGNGIVVFFWDGPGSATVQETLIAGNGGPGVGVFGAKATLRRSVIRGNGSSGIIGVLLEDTPAQVSLEDCLIERNRGIGAVAVGSDLVVDRTAVRDTLLRQGIGFGVHAVGLEGRWPTLAMKESLVASSRFVGVQLFDAKASIEGCAIRDTLPDDKGQGGHGIEARYYHEPTRLTLKDSLVARSRGAGISVMSSVVSVEGSLVQRTLTEKQSEELGDGIWAGTMKEVIEVGTGKTIPVKDARRSHVTLQDSLVEGSARANLLFDGAGGTVERSLIRRGFLAVAVERGGDPELKASTVIEHNVEDRISFGQGLASPPPPVLPPAPKVPKP